MANLIHQQTTRDGHIWRSVRGGGSQYKKCPCLLHVTPIRDFPDHATFREKGAKLACADKLGVFLSLTLCKKANFEYLSFIK